MTSFDNPFDNKDTSRRGFIGKVAVAVSSFFFLPILSLRAATTAPVTAVPENDPIAISLGFKKDAAKVDTKKFPKRAGDAGKDQFCSTCMFFTKKDAKTGTCQIFAGRIVPAKGWCNSWAKKLTT